MNTQVQTQTSLTVTPRPKVTPGALERRLVNAGFRVTGALRRRSLERADPVRAQEIQLRRLVKHARATRFGREHRFDGIDSVAAFQRAVPIRRYEALWDDYLRASYPVFENLTWPGRIPYIALSSGTTQGPTKFIPVSWEMVRSNRRGASTMLAWYLGSRPASRLFHGRICVLGGSTNLEAVAPGVYQGDLSGIAAVEVPRLLRPYAFPPLALALESDWDRKISQLAETAVDEPITLLSGVPGWLIEFLERVLERTGKSRIAEVWPNLELIVHGGVKFDPFRQSLRSLVGSSDVVFQEVYPSSEGFIAYGDPATGLLRLAFDHGIFYEFIPVDDLDSPQAVRHWLGVVEPGVNYAIVVSTCAGMWAHLIGDTVRFESLSPPLLTFTGRTGYWLSAFGEHLTSEEVEEAIAHALAVTGAVLRDWHLGPVFSSNRMGHHVLVVEFEAEPPDPPRFRDEIDRCLCLRNADYQAHRTGGAGLPAPAMIIAGRGAFEGWMRSRGKLGGQNKVPRMDSTGTLTGELVEFLRAAAKVRLDLPEISR
jgi:GH3 auxin-responsive promoter